MVILKDDYAIPNSIVQQYYQYYQLLHYMRTHIFSHIPLLSPPAHVIKPFKKRFTNLQMCWISYSLFSTLCDGNVVICLYISIFAYLYTCVYRWLCTMATENQSEKQSRSINKSKKCYNNAISIDNTYLIISYLSY